MCDHCADQLGGSYPKIGSKCTCAAGRAAGQGQGEACVGIGWKNVAAQIAARIFTFAGDGSRAKHLRMYTTTESDGKYMGGWSEEPLADFIESVLNNLSPPPTPHPEPHCPDCGGAYSVVRHERCGDTKQYDETPHPDLRAVVEELARVLARSMQAHQSVAVMLKSPTDVAYHGLRAIREQSTKYANECDAALTLARNTLEKK